MNLKKLTLGSILLSASLFAGNYDVDKSHSKIGFSVKHMMISNVSGEFNNFNGSFVFDESVNMLKSLDGVVKINSINTGDVERDTHLKEKELFYAKKYDTMKIKATHINAHEVFVDITLRGVTKNIKLDLENGGSLKDPWGTKRAGFMLTGEINRKDFGISWNKIMETGGVVVGEIVKLNIDLQGIKK